MITRPTQLEQAASCLCNLWYGDEQETMIEVCIDEYDETIRDDIQRLCNDGDYNAANAVLIRHAFTPLSKTERDELIAKTAAEFGPEVGVDFNVAELVQLADEIMVGLPLTMTNRG